MLGLDKDDKTFEVLSHLYDRIRPVVATAPAPYNTLLPGLLQLTMATHDVDKETADESGDSTLNEGTSSNDGGAGSIKDLSANTSAEDIVVLSPAGPSTDEDVNMVTAMLGGEVVVEEKIPGKEMEVQVSAGQEKDEELKKAALKADEPEVVEV